MKGKRQVDLACWADRRWMAVEMSQRGARPELFPTGEVRWPPALYCIVSVYHVA